MDVHGQQTEDERQERISNYGRARQSGTVWKTRGSRALNIYHFSWAIYVTESRDLQIGKSISNILLGVWDFKKKPIFESSPLF